MEEENKKNDSGSEEELEVLVSWEIAEYSYSLRSRRWYIVAGVLGFLSLIWALFTANFLFAIIIIMAATIFILTDKEKDKKIQVSLTDEGMLLGNNFYDYDEFKNFSLVYKPKQGLKTLYLEFKNFFKHRISLPLEDVNPLKVQEILSQYLEEDRERTDPPLSEQLSKSLKLQ